MHGEEDFDLFVNQNPREGYLRFNRDIEDFVGSVVRDQSGVIINNGAAAPGFDVESELSVPYDEEASDDVVFHEGEQLAVEVHEVDDAVSVDFPQPSASVCMELSRAFQMLQRDR